MVHGKRCMALFYTPAVIRKTKRKAFLVPGCGMWTLEYLATQQVTHTVLTHLIWIAAVLLVTTHDKQGLVKWEPRQT